MESMNDVTLPQTIALALTGIADPVCELCGAAAFVSCGGHLYCKAQWQQGACKETTMDVNGNDNSPEWGYCTEKGCKEPAEPLWFSGGFPDDPDLSLCHKHIGTRMLAVETERDALRTALRALLASYENYASEHKPPSEWDEYDRMIFPHWQAARLLLAADGVRQKEGAGAK